jgi:GT2 family glycosyltransferase
MTNKTLEQLYAEHVGKVSDKWSIYLTEYRRIFDEHRDRPIRLLEIGIQNGGSLEIWSKYFPHAQKLVGCDINPDCARLSYEDPRIAVVVGDANSDTAQAKVLGYAPAFDVIIDDGSHRSSDIVKSFARYFPHLADGGVFVAEDLHCSYWQQFEGGLFDPFSSITFFKRLADVVSHEHWGIEKARTDILSGFFAKYGSQIDEETLQHVHSVEFSNSMCVIHKDKPVRNRMGTRLIVGSVGTVVPKHVLRSSIEEIPDQTGNVWTARSMPPDEELLLRIKELAERDSQIAALNQTLAERDGQIAGLNRAVAERDQALVNRDVQIANLSEGITERDGRIANLNKVILAYQKSKSWRVTQPLRVIGHHLRVIGHQIKRIKHRSDLGSRQLAKGSLRLYIDRPKLGLVNIAKDSYDIAGWAVDIEAHSAAKVRIVVGKTLQHPHPTQREDVQRVFAPVCELPLDTGFASVLMLPVGVYRMRIEVEGVDGSWIPVRRALLLRIPGISRAHQTEPNLSYSAWTRLEQKRLKEKIPDIKLHIEVMVHKPTFTVVVDTRQGGTGLGDTIQSIRRQLYPFWDVRVLSGAAASSLRDDMKTLSRAKGAPTRAISWLGWFRRPPFSLLKNMSLSDIRGDFIVFMQSGQRLASNALYEFAAAINQRPDIDLIYGDEDSFTGSGSRRDPFHKPDWSPDYLETFNYIGFPACFRAALARGCFDNAHVYDFVLRFTERTTRVLHIPKILGHGVEKLGVEEAASANAVALDIKALSGRLSRTGRRGSVYEHELHKGCYSVRLDLKRSPLVSVVIPTAGKTVTVGERRIDLIKNVIGQIRDRSTYNNIEIIVVDNGDLSPNQLGMLAEAKCKRITYSDPVCNIAEKLNLGVSIANGDLLLLLNDDIEILTPSWIERLLEHFEKPHVGVVGAKLLYPNEQTQHVGVVQPFGNPDHVRRRFPRNDAGYFFSTCGVRNYSAVTGACMMTPASIYREVGGYADELPLNFNDVDFCMKVRRKGLSVVYTPSAELIHMESMSRVAPFDMAELAWYHQRWAAELVSDPFYNERFLTVEPPTFVPCVNQRML